MVCRLGPSAYTIGPRYHSQRYAVVSRHKPVASTIHDAFSPSHQTATPRVHSRTLQHVAIHRCGAHATFDAPRGRKFSFPRSINDTSSQLSHPSHTWLLLYIRRFLLARVHTLEEYHFLKSIYPFFFFFVLHVFFSFLFPKKKNIPPKKKLTFITLSIFAMAATTSQRRRRLVQEKLYPSGTLTPSVFIFVCLSLSVFTFIMAFPYVFFSFFREPSISSFTFFVFFVSFFFIVFYFVSDTTELFAFFVSLYFCLLYYGNQKNSSDTTNGQELVSLSG